MLRHQLPATQSQSSLLGARALVNEEVEAYRALVSALRKLPDGDGLMPFPEVVKLEQWAEVRLAAQELVRWLTE